jgi:hypothetical protein
MTPGVGRTTVRLAYGGCATHFIGRTSARVSLTLREGSSGIRRASDCWSDLLTSLYRGGFGPLARSRAYADAARVEPTVETALEGNWLYRDFLGAMWPDTVSGLQRVFADPAENEIVIPRIRNHLRELLAKLGVTYRGASGGQCWVEFAHQARANAR